MLRVVSRHVAPLVTVASGPAVNTDTGARLQDTLNTRQKQIGPARGHHAISRYNSGQSRISHQSG